MRAERGHPRTTGLREVVDGISRVPRGGIAWRMIPDDVPPGATSERVSPRNASVEDPHGTAANDTHGFGKVSDHGKERLKALARWPEGGESNCSQ